MSRRRLLVPVFIVAWVLVPLLSTAYAATPACSKFEVGSKKWQDCVENVASGGSDKSDNQKGGNEGDTNDTTNDGDTSDGSACSQFDVGSDKWQECITNSFNGVGGGIKGQPGTACSEFNVGSKEWRDCIEGAATGGGLMPWIIVIPLGVMVLGMMFMFARQARRARNFESGTGSQVGSTAGSWLIFMAFIEGSMGVGSAVAESRAAGSFGGYGIAAVVLLGVAVIMLIAGVIITIKARAKRQIEETGSPGRATVVRLSQTGTYINENPVFFFELDVNVPGIPQYRTTQRSTVPMYLVQGIGPGAVFPVKVNTSNPTELVIDWSGVSAVRTGDQSGWGGATPGAPATPTAPMGAPPTGQTPFPGSTGTPGTPFPGASGTPEQPS